MNPHKQTQRYLLAKFSGVEAPEAAPGVGLSTSDCPTTENLMQQQHVDQPIHQLSSRPQPCREQRDGEKNSKGTEDAGLNYERREATKNKEEGGQRE